jgi:serine/threonine protein kinase
MRFFSFFSSFITAWRDYPAEENAVLGNRYTVLEMIGEGSYGLTYKCLDQESGSVVAVKQARRSKGLYAKHLLSREAQILKLFHHPQIPACKDFFTEGRNTYLVMTYLDGDTLENLIFEKSRQYGEQECVLITLQLLELVEYIHQKEIVHLDLRIPNVLFIDEQLYLIDFGLARRIGEPPPLKKSAGIWSKDSSNVSSGRYKPSVEKADLQDIGHFMLFMLYSAYEPEANSNESVEQSWREELNLSLELNEMIERLLEQREPYSSSSQFMNDLRALTNKRNYPSC